MADKTLLDLYTDNQITSAQLIAPTSGEVLFEVQGDWGSGQRSGATSFVDIVAALRPSINLSVQVEGDGAGPTINGILCPPGANTSVGIVDPTNCPFDTTGNGQVVMGSVEYNGLVVSIPGGHFGMSGNANIAFPFNFPSNVVATIYITASF